MKEVVSYAGNFFVPCFMYPLKTSLSLITHGNVYSSANSLNGSGSK